MEVWISPLSLSITSLWYIHHCCTVKSMDDGVCLSCKSPTCTNLHSASGCHAISVPSWNLKRAITWYPYLQPSPPEQPSDCGFIRWLLSGKGSTTWTWPTGVVTLVLAGSWGAIFLVSPKGRGEGKDGINKDHMPTTKSKVKLY